MPVDFVEIATGIPGLSPQGTIRVARQDTGPVMSIDGSNYVPLGGGGPAVSEQVLAAKLLNRGDLVPYFRYLAAERFLTMQNVVAGSESWGPGEIQFGTGAAATPAYQVSGVTGGNHSQALRTGVDFYTSCRFRLVSTVAGTPTIGFGAVEGTFANF